MIDRDIEAVRSIACGGAHLLELVDSITALAEIEAGEIVLKMSTFDARNLIDEVVKCR